MNFPRTLNLTNKYESNLLFDKKTYYIVLKNSLSSDLSLSIPNEYSFSKDFSRLLIKLYFFIVGTIIRLPLSYY